MSSGRRQGLPIWTATVVVALATACGGAELGLPSDDDASNSEADSNETTPATSTSTPTTGVPPTTGDESTSSGDSSGTSGTDSGSDESTTGGSEASWEWDLPPGFPVPRVPEDNPMSAEKVELGRHLFYEVRLSDNETQSCGSCHEQAKGFADGLVLSSGSTGDVLPRNSMALANVAYSASHTWANPVLEHLSDQAAVPLFGEDPIELGAIFAEEEILDRLRDVPMYRAMFEAAYPEEDDPFSWINIRRAIASFERTMISGSSPYDRYLHGEADAITESARRGAALFNSEVLECHHCHGGFNFSNSVVHADTAFDTMPFFNTGLYNIGDSGGYPVGGWGLFEFTADPADMGKFKPPSLRNIAVTGPYMHDGSISTLDEVLDHYAAGGRTIEDGENAGEGSLNPNKSGFVVGFELSAQDRADMLAFFEALTDDAFLSDPRLSDPWARR